MKGPHSKTISETAAPAIKAPSELNQAGHWARGLSRRSVLKSLAGAAAAGLPSAVVQVFAQRPAEPSPKLQTPEPEVNVQNPAWYGFNLFEYFSTDPDWMKYFPYQNDGMFVEDDFRWIRDWGFNFVRLPMDYRFWTDADDLMKIHEQKVEPIDRAIRLGEKYGVHVNICLHRAPGYCSLDQQDPAIGMIPKIDLDQGNLSRVHITVEKMNLFRDSQALEAFAHQWTFFAQRYKGISSERLSFNLVNEPNPPMTPAEREALSASSMEHKDPLGVASEIFWGRNEQYARVARVAIAAIRSIDPQRLIVCDGHGGASPVPDLIDTGVLQSRHDYFPMDLTLYEAEWLPRPQPRKIRITSGGTGLAVSAPLYSGHWPEVNPFGHVDVDRDTIERAMGRWRKLEQQGVRIHFGEMGCYKYTPHKVVLGWSRDTLDAISKLHSGWALRNFRGPFGILDTERQGTKYEDWHGHQLDRALLNLLQKKMKA